MDCLVVGVDLKENTHIKYNVSAQLLEKSVIVWGREGGNLVAREVGKLDCKLTCRRCL